MESLAGAGIRNSPASLTLFFGTNVLSFSLMVVFGMDVKNIVNCLKPIGVIGKTKLLEMRQGIKKSFTVLKKMAGEFYDYGSIPLKHQIL